MRTYAINDTPENVAYLTQEDIPFKKSSNKKLEVECPEDSDIFELGWELSKRRHEEQPEEFYLNGNYADYFKEAINIFSESSHWEVNTIKFSKDSGDTIDRTKVTVYPTKGFILLGIYSLYGKIVAEQEAKIIR